jgi:predicted ferric reductase
MQAGVTFLVILSSKPLRSRVYEVFSHLHLMFAAAATGTIYLHVPSKELLKPPVLYLFTAVSLQVFIAAVRFGQVLYRNVRFRKPLNRASIRAITFKSPHKRDIPVSDGVHVHVQLSRPWRPEAGQYAYLCIPGVSYTSFAQLHPFYISWWYRDDQGNSYVVFIVQRQRGFTKNLLLHTGNSFEDGSAMRAVIEGPYGKKLKLDSYGTVLLFATGIGIAGQLPYVENLLEGYHNCEVKTRRIALFWEVESECKRNPKYTTKQLTDDNSANRLGRGQDATSAEGERLWPSKSASYMPRSTLTEECRFSTSASSYEESFFPRRQREENMNNLENGSISPMTLWMVRM